MMTATEQISPAWSVGLIQSGNRRRIMGLIIDCCINVQSKHSQSALLCLKCSDFYGWHSMYGWLPGNQSHWIQWIWLWANMQSLKKKKSSDTLKKNIFLGGAKTCRLDALSTHGRWIGQKNVCKAPQMLHWVLVGSVLILPVTNIPSDPGVLQHQQSQFIHSRCHFLLPVVFCTSSTNIHFWAFSELEWIHAGHLLQGGSTSHCQDVAFISCLGCLSNPGLNSFPFICLPSLFAFCLFLPPPSLRGFLQDWQTHINCTLQIKRKASLAWHKSASPPQNLLSPNEKASCGGGGGGGREEGKAAQCTGTIPPLSWAAMMSAFWLQTAYLCFNSCQEQQISG